MKEEINLHIKQRIENYKQLHFGNKKVVTPYFINDKRRKDLRAMVGKGTPEEITMEAKIWEKLKGVSLDQLSSEDIKEFLTARGLGIDCSGFIVHILDSYYKKTKNNHIWNYLKIPNTNLISKVRYYLRPVEQLGAEVITNLDNCYEVDIKDIKPGDLIRSKTKKNNGHHIMIITEVERNSHGDIINIEYTHSTPHYQKDNGVKTGLIEIIDQNKPLEFQNWKEIDLSGVNHTLEGYLTNVEDNGIRRLKSF